MSIIGFVILAGVVLLALFLAVRTLQSIAKIAVTMALLGFVVMVGILLAFSLGLEETKTLAAVKEKAAGMFQPIGKAMGFFSSRDVIEQTREKVSEFAKKGNKTKE